MTQAFTLYVDRLGDGDKEKIQEIASPEFLDIHEKELSFPHPVSITGEAYLVDQDLILHLKISTDAYIPCRICNDPVKVPIIIEDFYHAEPLQEISSKLFDYTDLLRDAILLQIPPFAECRDGNCPERESVSKFLKKTSPAKGPSEPNYFPFSDL